MFKILLLLGSSAVMVGMSAQKSKNKEDMRCKNGSCGPYSYRHLQQWYKNIFLNSSQIEMLNTMANEFDQENESVETVLKSLSLTSTFSTVGGDGDICCSTRTTHFANTTLVNIYGVLRSVIHLPDANPPSYQYIPHGSCLFTGLCPGRCQTDQKVLTLLVLTDTLDLLFDLFAIPGDCSCKNI